MLKLDLKLAQKLNLTTELIESIELVELNSMELDSFLQKESEDNVLLDYDIKINDREFRKYFKENINYMEKYSSKEQYNQEEYISYNIIFRDFLIEQLRFLNLNREEYKIGKFLIDNINDRGYLDIGVQDAASILNIDTHDVFYILKKIWEFEPKGVGARDLRECLLLQVDSKQIILRKIIEDHLEDVSKNKLPTISKKLNISLQELKGYIEEIKRLNPKPTSGYITNRESISYIKPEIFVKIRGRDIDLEIEEKNSNIHINDYYLNLLETQNSEDIKKYLSKKLSRTIFLINAIEKRRLTIEKVTNEIIKRQRDFFISGGPLKVLRLKDIASSLDISESTVSRATKNKYLQCSRGIFQLKYFFNTSINTNLGQVSKNYIMEKIKDIIENENKNKPLSDNSIANILNDQGVEIKRRTVTKYREDMGILSTLNRKTYD